MVLLQILSVSEYDGRIGHHKQNVSIPVSEGVTACAVHPLNGTIVAGTQVSTQRKILCIFCIIKIKT